MMEEGKVYHAFIEGYGSDGTGIARIDGMVVFVKHGIRDELVDVFVEHVGHHAAWGRVVKVIQPCPGRRQPDCPHYAVCGGCQFRHMNYAEELEAKRIRVEDALRRIGGAEIRVPKIWGAARIDRYRNKVQLPVSDQAIGYYRARTHQVVDIDDCLLQPERANACRRAVREWMNVYQVPAYREKEHKGLIRHLYLRFNQAGETLCCLVVNGRSVPHGDALVELLRAADPSLAGVVLSVNTRRTNVILGDSYVTLWGRDWLEETLCGLDFRLSVPSFFQINREQTEVLYGRALEFAGLTGQETVLDLYCGIGSISLCLAKQAGRVIGAEVVPQAIEDAKANARRSGITNAEFFCGDAGEVARRLAEEGTRPQVVCVDPPRKGLAPDVVETIADMKPERVVYVSCDPATLGRDVKRFCERGYRAVQAEAVDLFPRTAHVETVCLLSKLNVKEHIEVELDMDELDLTTAESKATYEEIREYVLEHTGLKVSHLYIAQVKQKYGIIERENYNKPKSENSRQPKCPPEKEAAITDALKFFGMV